MKWGELETLGSVFSAESGMWTSVAYSYVFWLSLAGFF